MYNCVCICTSAYVCRTPSSIAQLFLQLICWHRTSYWTMKSSIWMNCISSKPHGHFCLLPPSSRTTGMPHFAQLVSEHWRMNLNLMVLWQAPHWQSYFPTPSVSLCSRNPILKGRKQLILYYNWNSCWYNLHACLVKIHTIIQVLLKKSH